MSKEANGKELVLLGAIPALLYGAEATPRALVNALGANPTLASLLGAVLAGAAHLCTHTADRAISEGAKKSRQARSAHSNEHLETAVAFALALTLEEVLREVPDDPTLKHWLAKVERAAEDPRSAEHKQLFAERLEPDDVIAGGAKDPDALHQIWSVVWPALAAWRVGSTSAPGPKSTLDLIEEKCRSVFFEHFEGNLIKVFVQEVHRMAWVSYITRAIDNIQAAQLDGEQKDALVAAIQTLQEADFKERDEALKQTLASLLKSGLSEIRDLVKTEGGADKLARTVRSLARCVAAAHEKGEPTVFPYARRSPEVMIRASVGEEPQFHGDIVSLIGNAIGPRSLTLVFGDYGAGKSYTCGKVAKLLADKVMLSEGKLGRAPIILQLRRAKNLNNLVDLALSSLTAMYGFYLERADLLAAMGAGRVAFILDGLDEMIAQTDRKDVRYHLSSIVMSPFFSDTPFMVTTRPNVIASFSEYKLLYSYSLMTVDPLDREEAKRFLEAMDLRELVVAMERGTAAKLQDLMSRPLYLEMLVATSERLLSELTHADSKSSVVSKLYGEYFEYWFWREVEALGLPPGDLDIGDIRSILASAAEQISCSKTRYLSEDQFRACVLKHLPSHIQNVQTIVKDARERLILVPEFIGDATIYRFRHDSLRAYFYAYYLADRIRDGAIAEKDLSGIDIAAMDFVIGMAESDGRIADFLSLTANRWGEGEDPTTADLLGFMWLIGKSSPLDAKRVRWLCQGDETIRSIIVGHLCRVTFEPGSRFSGISLVKADFSSSNVKGGLFEGGSLEGANFAGATLGECCFSLTDLTGVKFSATSDLQGAKLSHVRAVGAHFENIQGPELTFEECSFERSYFQGAKLVDAKVNGGRFVDVGFDGAELRNATFTDCHLERCTFTKANLIGTTFLGCKFIDTTLGEANFRV